MNASKVLISSMVAASVVGVIGLAYAQTPPSPTSPTTSPGMQETNPPLSTTPPNTVQPNNSGNMNAPANRMTTDSAAMDAERAARNDRN